MASTLNEIAYGILGKVRPHLTDDSDLTIENVKHDVAVERAKLLKQQLSRTYRISENFVSDLGCLELELADAAECCGLSTDCKVLRTKLELPTFINVKGNVQITRVGPIVKHLKGFKVIPVSQVQSAGNGMFSQKKVYAYYMNNRIYIFTKDSSFKILKYINVRGVLEDPSDAKDFICDPSGTKTCYTDDDPYKVTKDIESTIRRILINEYTAVDKNPKDLGNDAKDQKTDA